MAEFSQELPNFFLNFNETKITKAEGFLCYVREEELERQRSHNVNKNMLKSNHQDMVAFLRRVARAAPRRSKKNFKTSGPEISSYLIAKSCEDYMLVQFGNNWIKLILGQRDDLGLGFLVPMLHKKKSV